MPSVDINEAPNWTKHKVGQFPGSTRSRLDKDSVHVPRANMHKTSPPLETAKYTFEGPAGTAGVWPDQDGGPGFEVWLDGQFVGDFLAESEAIGVAESASEHGFHGSAPDEPEPTPEPSSGPIP